MVRKLVGCFNLIVLNCCFGHFHCVNLCQLLNYPQPPVSCSHYFIAHKSCRIIASLKVEVVDLSRLSEYVVVASGQFWLRKVIGPF